MVLTNGSNSDGRRHNIISHAILLFLVISLAPTLSACGSVHSDSEGRQLPSDTQVLADVTPRDSENVVDVRVIKDRDGESYLHANNLVWYFDRGVVIKRKAQLAEALDAVVVVGGLA